MIPYSFCKAEQSFNSDFYYIQLRGTDLNESLTCMIKAIWHWLCFKYSLKVSEIFFFLIFHFVQTFRNFCRRCQSKSPRCSKKIVFKYQHLRIFSIDKRLYSGGTKRFAVLLFFQKGWNLYFSKLTALVKRKKSQL